jgi:hypothetical protein
MINRFLLCEIGTRVVSRRDAYGAYLKMELFQLQGSPTEKDKRFTVFNLGYETRSFFAKVGECNCFHSAPP